MQYFTKNPVLPPGLISIDPPPAKSKSEVKIINTIKDLDIVALTEDLYQYPKYLLQIWLLK
jgi:hypothetical protein